LLLIQGLHAGVGIAELWKRSSLWKVEGGSSGMVVDH